MEGEGGRGVSGNEAVSSIDAEHILLSNKQNKRGKTGPGNCKFCKMRELEVIQHLGAQVVTIIFMLIVIQLFHQLKIYHSQIYL